MASAVQLRQRFAEVRAELATAVGPDQLASEIARWRRGLTVAVDHCWLRAALACLPAEVPPPQVINSGCPLDPLTVDTFITVGLGAIPETGTVIVAASEPQAWRLTLVAPRQLIVIPAPQAALEFSAALALTTANPGSVLWITGPSRTADIEKVLVPGAQGAHELIVVIYQDPVEKT